MNGNSILSQSPMVCFDAQTQLGSANEYNNGALDPDVGGAFTAISNIVINTLLPILIASPEDITPSIFLLFSQTIPILLATLCSIHSDNLSLFDAHFTAAVTASPMSIYVSASCFLYLFSTKESRPSLFARISDEAHRLTCAMGLVLPVLWLSVSVITSFSTTAFRNSIYCAGMTLPKFMEFLLVSSFTGVLDVLGRRDLWDDLSKRWGLGLISLLGMWVWAVYLVRHRGKITEECMKPIKEIEKEVLPRWRLVRLAKEYLFLVWRVPKVSWEIITTRHRTMIVWFLFCIHWSWVLGISRSIVFNRTQVSYGQVLSIFGVLPPIWSFGNILLDNRANIKDSIKKTPSFVSEGVRFIFTGRYKRPSLREAQEINAEPEYFKWSRRRWLITLVSFFAYIGLHSVWIVFYVLAGSMPNNRTKVNEPHRNWKPYSVCMLINGYCCSIVCIFLSVALFDYARMRSPSLNASPGSESDYAMKALISFPECHTSPLVHRISRSRYPRILRLVAFTVSVVITVMFCGGPFFVPYLALPLAQEWHWKHDCDSYPAEIILYGQHHISQAAVISFYVTNPNSPTGLYPPNRVKVYDFKFYTPEGSDQNLRVLEYLEPSELAASNTSYNEFGTLSPFLRLPDLRTLVLDTAQRRFIGCSAGFKDLVQSFANTTYAQVSLDSFLNSCSEGEGTYDNNPYLQFSIGKNSTSSVHIEAESKEWAYIDDAPSFSLLRSTNPTGTAPEGLTESTIWLRSALTKRNHPTILKVCSNAVDVSVETLGPLGVVTGALNRFSIFISRPRIFSTV